jgi:hypothetical protein
MRSRPAILVWTTLVFFSLASAAAHAACLVDQVQESWNSTSGGFRWQSFTAGETGALCRVDLNTADGQQDVSLEIYEGEGTLGVQLHQQIVDLPGDETSIALDALVQVEAGSTYTLHFPEIPTWRLQTGDPYPGGIGNINPDVDFWFRTHVDAGGSVPAEAASWGAVKATFAD